MRRPSVRSIRRSAMPFVQHAIGARFGGCLRLIGARGLSPRQVRLGRWWDVQLVLQVLAPPPPGTRLALRTRQYGQQREARCARDVDRLPASAWRPGDVLVIPCKVHADAGWLTVGSASLELTVLAGDGVALAAIPEEDAAAVIRDRCVELVRLQLTAATR